MDAIARRLVLKLEILETLEGCFGCNGGSGADVFLSKREGRDAIGKVPAEKEVETFITFAQGQNGDSVCYLFRRQRSV
jgi:hypothetical protein